MCEKTPASCFLLVDSCTGAGIAQWRSNDIVGVECSPDRSVGQIGIEAEVVCVGLKVSKRDVMADANGLATDVSWASMKVWCVQVPDASANTSK